MNRVPEPALIRGVLITITSVIAFFLNREIDVTWVDAVLTIYTIASGLLAGAVIRPAVTPVAKLQGAASRLGE